ncbi:MAG: hypothetical protein AB7K09_03850 [Planctomycetota bacterium]
MRRAIATLGILALVAALSVGCIKQGVSTSVKADGSGTVSMTVALSKTMIEMMKQMGGGEGEGEGEGEKGLFDNTEENLKKFPAEWGATATKYSDDKFEGVTVALKFTSLAMLKEQLAKLNENTGEGGGPQIIKDWVIKQEGDKVTIGVTVDAKAMKQDGADADNPMAAQMMKDAVFTFDVEMPKVDSFEAADGTGKKEEGKEKVTWTIKLDSNKEYKLSATGSGFKAATTTPEGTGEEKKEEKKEGGE